MSVVCAEHVRVKCWYIMIYMMYIMENNRIAKHHRASCLTCRGVTLSRHEEGDLDLQNYIVSSICKGNCSQSIEHPKNAICLGEAVKVVYSIRLPSSMSWHANCNGRVADGHNSCQQRNSTQLVEVGHLHVHKVYNVIWASVASTGATHTWLNIKGQCIKGYARLLGRMANTHTTQSQASAKQPYTKL